MQQVRKSNTINGVLNSLANSGALSDREAAYYRYHLTSGMKAWAWDQMVARFGLQQVPNSDRLMFTLPTERGDLGPSINNVP